MGEYEYGQPIPKQYRNRLFEWEGGGYSGCFWQMNQGIVDENGHWKPIFSTGCDGIDQDEWYDRKIINLKDELGYDCRAVQVQHEEIEHRAEEEVFHKKWYEIKGDQSSDPRVMALLEDENKRYDEFKRRKGEYDLEKTHRLDYCFMEALKREREKDRPTEIGLLDDAHIKETCGEFCRRYEGNVGMMVNVLDRLDKMGYDVWCTCSDCKEQFQARDFDSFACSIDEDAYTGDGGIGIIMKRVLCDNCYSDVQCPVCFSLSRPNENKKGASDWGSYDFLSCLMLDWLNVCCYCADGFDHDHLRKWDEKKRSWDNTELGERFYRIAETLEEKYDKRGHELYESLAKTPSGRMKINEIRNLLQDAAVEYFKDEDCREEDFGYRLDTDLPGQMKLDLDKKEG